MVSLRMAHEHNCVSSQRKGLPVSKIAVVVVFIYVVMQSPHTMKAMIHGESHEISASVTQLDYRIISSKLSNVCIVNTEVLA